MDAECSGTDSCVRLLKPVAGMEYRAARRAEPFVSGTYAETRSLEPRRDPGTDLEGTGSELFWLNWFCASSEGGEVS